MTKTMTKTKTTAKTTAKAAATDKTGLALVDSVTKGGRALAAHITAHYKDETSAIAILRKMVNDPELKTTRTPKTPAELLIKARVNALQNALRINGVGGERKRKAAKPSANPLVGLDNAAIVALVCGARQKTELGALIAALQKVAK